MRSFPSARRYANRVPLVLLMGILLVCVFLFFMACSNPPAGDLRYASVTEDFKTEYYVGDSFVAIGELKMFSDSTTFKTIPITEEMVSGFDTSIPGDVIVKISYEDFVASVPIRVHPINAVSLIIDEGTFPSVIYEKQPFPVGSTMTVLLSNGTTMEHIPVTSLMLGGFDSSCLGEQTITVGYLGASVSVNINIKQDVRVSISLKGAKDNYAVGEDLSVSGASLEVTYESGKVVPISLTPNLVSDFTTLLGGSFTATIRYHSLECDYPYTVTKVAQTITIAENSLPSVFEKGDSFPLTGRAVVVFDDGTTRDIVITEENIPEFSTSTQGDKSVRVVFSGASTTYDYFVYPEIVSAIPYGYTSAVMQGTTFDGLGKLIVLYEGEVREEIPFRGDVRLTISYSTAEEGDVEQKVRFRGRDFCFTVHVYPESDLGSVDHIEVAGTFRTIKKGDPLDVTGVQVYIVYKYLAPELVNLQETWASVDIPEDIDDCVIAPVTISCFGVEYKSSVRVLSVDYAQRVTSIVATGFRSLYVTGESLVTDGATLTVFYGGDYRVESDVLVQESFITDFSTENAGDFKMSVTYEGFSIQVAYKVIDSEEASRVTDLDVPDFAPLLFVGDGVQDIKVESYTINVTFGYGYGRDIVPLAAEMLSGETFIEAGRQEITLAYQGFRKTLYVRVYPESDKTQVTSISVQSNVTAYVGSQPDYSQTMLTIIYGYGFSQENISLVSASVTISPIQNTEEGMVMTTVTYAGCTCDLFVNFVSEESANILQRIEIETGSKTEFTVGESFNGVRLIAYYTNGSTEAVDVTTEMASGFDSQTSGNYSITISYCGKGAVYNYVVS